MLSIFPRLKKTSQILLAVSICSLVFACTSEPAEKPDATSLATVEKKLPSWAENANIYEVNIRQYTDEGTIKAFEAHLPRLQEMGVKILWLMPIQPIGKKNRKGSLGSYYSISDYAAVNPEFGTLDDVKRLVQKAHDSEMYVILDWVANHSAWDNPWVKNEGWYTLDSIGNMIPPVPDWSDVADLNYDNHDMRAAMIRAMKFWITETDMDGFRCDMAGMVPADFWPAVRSTLDQIKPVFMLAEGEGPQYHDAFDMSYTWEIHHTMRAIANGEKNANDIAGIILGKQESYPENAYLMQFTSNHDENSWQGTVYERLAGGVKTFAVLTATVPGMPLIYSGQEAGLNKRLAFFEKDTINWENLSLADFYKTLLSLKTKNKALWNGSKGGALQRLSSDNDEAVFAFLRESSGDQVLVVLNLSNADQSVTLEADAISGNYQEIFGDGGAVALEKKLVLHLNPWEYLVYARLR